MPADPRQACCALSVGVINRGVARIREQSTRWVRPASTRKRPPRR